MKLLALGLLLFVTIIFCVWQQKTDEEPTVLAADLSVKWNDTLLTHLPKILDTTIIVEDIRGSKLRFYQYIRVVFDHEAMIYHDKGIWKLQRFTASAMDSLEKDDYAMAKSARFAAYREKDTVKSYEIKLAKIAVLFAQADRVLVLKSERLMYFKRKQKTLKVLNIDLGFTPVGKKISNKDGKTPEGIYHLDCKYGRNDKFYKSFWVSYPSKTERALAKSKGIDPGFGITIHGTPVAKNKAVDWTAGCIALQNSDMDTLFKYVPEGAVIEIKK